MESPKLDASYTIDKLAWSIALISLLAALALVYLVTVFTMSTYRRMYATAVEAGIASKKYTEASNSLTRLFSGPPVLNIFGGANENALRSGKEVATGLIATLQSLTPTTLPAAKQKLSNTIRYLSTATGISADVQRLISQLDKPLTQAMLQAESLESMLIERRKISGQLSSALTQYDLLAKDASELFSLPTADRSAEGRAPTFYTDGVLAKIPTLNGIPDNIPSLDALKENLSDVGGGVRLSGENVHEIFMNRLTTLQRSGAGIEETLVNTSTKLGNLDREAKTLTAQLALETDRLSEEFSAALNLLISSLAP